MYPYTKRQDRNIVARFTKDWDLMYPERNPEEINQKRDAYIADLISKPDFVTTNKANDKRYAEPLKKTLLNFSGKEKFLIFLCAFIIGGTSYGVIKSEEKPQSQLTTKDKIENAAIVLLAMLIGTLFGTATVAALKRTNRESAIDNFYNRLVIRYFNKLKKIAPNVFTEDIIMNCNPEMARVITAILMANMPEQDTRKIQEIALSVPFLYSNTDIKTMKIIESDIETALKIIEQNLANNLELGNLVESAYTGYIPTTFILNSELQQTK